MPLNGDCNLGLPDPRIQGSEGHYCEDLNFNQLKSMGAIHFNYSSFYDIGVARFSNGIDQYTSSQSSDGKARPPDVGGSYQWVAYEGTLWHPLRPPDNGLPVYVYTLGGDHWTTSAPPPTGLGWVRGPLQGWVVDPAAPKPAPSARRLLCFEKPGDHLTTTDANFATTHGYTACSRAFEGWMPY
jgi:hypothetical protein